MGLVEFEKVLFATRPPVPEDHVCATTEPGVICMECGGFHAHPSWNELIAAEPQPDAIVEAT